MNHHIIHTHHIYIYFLLHTSTNPDFTIWYPTYIPNIYIWDIYVEYGGIYMLGNRYPTPPHFTQLRCYIYVGRQIYLLDNIYVG